MTERIFNNLSIILSFVFVCTHTYLLCLINLIFYLALLNMAILFYKLIQMQTPQ